MILGLPWWLWLIGAIAGFLIYGFSAAKAWRASFRGEFLAYLRREAPEIDVVAERDREIDVRGAGGSTGTLRLDRLFAEGTNIPNDDVAAREGLFAHFVKALREGRSADALDPDRDRARVRPRLVTDDFLRRLRADGLRATGKTISALPSGVAGLSVVLVLDNEHSVAYLTDALLAELKLTPDEAALVARENLARSVDMGAIVRRTLDEGAMNVMKTGDTYDAARLLLIPGCLREGEEVAAAIPDRDTLVLMRPPASGDWSGYRKIAQTPDGEALWREPVLVRSTGIGTVAAGGSA